MFVSRFVSIVLVLALAGCGGEDDTPPPPSTPPATPVAAPPPTAPTTPSPPPVSTPPQLTGMYELVWMDDGPNTPQQVMPEALIAQLPGCIWMRWGWTFEGDQLTVSNQLLCRAPPDFGPRHGVCSAQFTTAVDWRPNGFTLRAPVASRGEFTLIESHGEARDTSSANCTVRLGALDATVTDVVPGPMPNRPAELTLQLGDGGHMRLRAVVDPAVDYGAIIDQHEG